MQLLKKRILQDGRCFEGGILKVDSFINHQMDPTLMKSIGVEFVRRFASTGVNKIMTIGSQRYCPCYHDRVSVRPTRCICEEKIPQNDSERFEHNGSFVYQRPRLRCRDQFRFPHARMIKCSSSTTSLPMAMQPWGLST